MRLAAVLCSAFMLMPVTAFCQAGSTGGSIGKTDKAISGGNEIGEPRAAGDSNHSRRRTSQDREKPAAGPTLTGQWRWHSNCGIWGRHQGSFEIGQIEDGHFTGTIVNGDQSTSTINGRVSINSISFDSASLEEKWNGTITSGHMSGSVSGVSVVAYQCQWTASR